jgi:two-component system C4-dicarboxylate transport sensor histidine kinase DctB
MKQFCSENEALNTKFLNIAYECLSSIGNSFELESMMSEVVIDFYQNTKAAYVGFYEDKADDSPMICVGRVFDFDTKNMDDECSLIKYENSYIILLSLKIGYLKFVYDDTPHIKCIHEIICKFKKKINFALNACLGVKEIEKLNDELEYRIEKSVQQIREQERMLLVQSKNAIMGEMLEMVAHQWRQPLTSIGMISNNILLKIILNEDQDLSIGKFENELEGINKQVKYLSDTIDDFRNFFKESKTKKEVYVTEIVQKSVSLIKKQFEHSAIEIELVNDASEVILYTYINELTQVFLNILHNSRDAFDSQNIKNKKIKIHCFPVNENLTIKIEDNAGGIDDVVLPKIFEPYFSTKKQQNGTGIGLYMSKIIINKHLEGDIYAKNIKNGASFIITVPIITKIKERY